MSFHKTDAMMKKILRAELECWIQHRTRAAETIHSAKEELWAEGNGVKVGRA